MATNLKITILGCGGAGGVPTLSRGWGACNPDNPCNRRRRPSILVEGLVESETARVLIDTSPDLREQLLDAGVNTLDGVVYTHAHADHIHGLDDLREVNRALGGALNIWADTETLMELKTRFGYAFEGLPSGEKNIYRPWLVAHEISAAFDINGLLFKPFVQDHGYMETLGFRIGDFAYSTDLLDLSAEAKAMLHGLELWIVGALTNDSAHETHVSLDKALDWIYELKPKRAVITHMGPALDYDAVAAECPANVEPAFDGMVLSTGERALSTE